MKNYLTHPLLKFAWLAQCSCRLYYFGLSLSFSGEPWLFLLMSSENFLMSFLVCYAGSTDDFVYDFYAMKDMMDMAHADASNPFPLLVSYFLYLCFLVIFFMLVLLIKFCSG